MKPAGAGGVYSLQGPFCLRAGDFLGSISGIKKTFNPMFVVEVDVW